MNCQYPLVWETVLEYRLIENEKGAQEYVVDRQFGSVPLDCLALTPLTCAPWHPVEPDLEIER